MSRSTRGDGSGGASSPLHLPARTISPARAAAFHILQRVESSSAHSDDLLHSPAVNALSQEDRNLAMALVLGTLRWQLHLDAVLRPMLQRPDADLHPAARIALRLGLLQMVHFDRVPVYAAVNESVELARSNGAAHAAGMVNALLRRALRERSEPVRQTLATALTPEEAAHPAWLLARWRTRFGAAAARRIAAYDQEMPPGNGLFLPDDMLPDIDDGSRLVAEIAAAAVPSPGRILDCCAAPGGKTMVLAARHPHAEIIACDISEVRLRALRQRLDSSAIGTRVSTVLTDMTVSPEGLQPESFNLILCDAPCSGTGTLARNPEIRHRLRESDLSRQAERQRAILQQALRLLAPGGSLVYATCSLEPEENEAVVAHALEEVTGTRPQDITTVLSGIEVLPEASRQLLLDTSIADGRLRTLPGTVPCDGFFAALLSRGQA